jgi:hypothetical protein
MKKLSQQIVFLDWFHVKEIYFRIGLILGNKSFNHKGQVITNKTAEEDSTALKWLLNNMINVIFKWQTTVDHTNTKVRDVA